MSKSPAQPLLFDHLDVSSPAPKSPAVADVPRPVEDIATDDAGSSVPADTKSADAYRTISEVATELQVPQHVLRFWESRFSAIRPLKRAGGRRYYRRQDIDLLKRIQNLLHHQGYTIKGVQKLLKATKGTLILPVGTNGEAQSLARTKMQVDPETTAMDAALVQHALTGGIVRPKPASSVPDVAQASAKAASLSQTKRKELESILMELKELRQILRQAAE
jgi:DNA-binding transcriptional MerR regulator